jgi:putative ABC transport system permease protein
MLYSRLFYVVRLSVRNLFVHGLRSSLTMLGIVFGVASVIVMLAVGEAAQFEVIQQIRELGATNIIVRSVKPLDEDKDQQGDDFLTYGLKRDDMDRLAATLPTIRNVTPLREFRHDVRRLDRKLDARVVSVMPEYQKMNGLKIARGRFLSQLENERFENVAVLGAETAEILFPVEDPVGQTLFIADKNYFLVFRVVGVTERRAASGNVGSSLSGQDYNRDVYIPFDTDRVRFGSVLMSFKNGNFKGERLEVSQITIQVDRMESVKRTATLIQGTLDQYHPHKDFEVVVPLDLLERAEKTQQIFTYVLGAIASISLVVGGIGIMNIMLATVTERTTEIGIRMAVGARSRDIALQFLVETMTLSSIGGLFGVGLGIGVSLIVNYSFHFPPILRLWSILLAFGVSVAVGLIFGTYPAVRASRLDPIEAIRHA